MTNGAQPQGTPQPAPAGKKSPWVFILAGCAAIVLIGTITVAGFLWWGYHKAKSYVDKELGGNMKTVSELWSDVPPMEGYAATKNDMPMPVKLLFRAILGNLGKLNKPGEDRTTGDIDWIAMSGNGKPDDLKAFYTPDRMTSAGWDKTEQSTCLSGSEQGFPQVGAFCVFQKNQDGKQTQLAIIAWEDADTKATDIFYLRLTPDTETH